MAIADRARTVVRVKIAARVTTEADVTVAVADVEIETAAVAGIVTVVVAVIVTVADAVIAIEADAVTVVAVIAIATTVVAAASGEIATVHRALSVHPVAPMPLR